MNNIKKRIDINGQVIKFKASKDIKDKYRKYLNRNFDKDILEFKKINKNNINPIISPISDLKKVNFEKLYFICWIFAKNADNSISKPSKWLEKFEEFPVIDIIYELIDLIAYSLTGDKDVYFNEKK